MQYTHEELLSLLPLQHLSFSAVREFLEDPRKFKKHYILGDWSGLSSQTLTAGSAFHSGLEYYWRARSEGVEDPMELIDLMRLGVDQVLERDAETTDWDKPRTIAKKDADRYEKMGCEVWEDKSGSKASWKAKVTPEVMASEVMDALAAYAADPPDYRPLLVEASHTAMPDDEEHGGLHPLPLKGKIDLVDDDRGDGFTFVDHKFVSREPSKDEATGEYVVTDAMRLQATAYDSIAADLMKSIGKPAVRPTRYIFDHFVHGKNVRIPIEYVVTDLDRIIWARIYRGAIYQIGLICGLPDEIGFLPNPFHPYNTDGWQEFVADVEMGMEETEKVENTAW